MTAIIGSLRFDMPGAGRVTISLAIAMRIETEAGGFMPCRYHLRG